MLEHGDWLPWGGWWVAQSVADYELPAPHGLRKVRLSGWGTSR
jgi:hypothetical protein